MNSVIAVLKDKIADQNVRFVFPSQTAAGLWAQKTCTLGIVRSVAAGRFLAWDRFKEELIRERETGRRPASLVMRKLFADALLRRNAEAPFLKSLVPAECAKEGGIFVSFIARLLPSLAFWEKLAGKAGNVYRGGDDEDRDYSALKKEYSAFLERYGLFEPSWEELKIKEGNERYVIFFPELIEDFAEYDALLLEPRFTRVNTEISGRPLCLEYESAREEIRAAVLELQRLHEEEGLPYEDMAVSVPELEEMEPNLLKEFTLRHIPFTRRAGKKLGETGAGRLFPLVNECASSDFSFNSLKALVLNDRIPWKERETNKKLIRFGIKYNCVSAYVQDGKQVDIWEEAFREGFSDGGRELQLYYGELKRRARALAGSKNFLDIRKNYFAFRRGLLDMEMISDEDNAILGRCVEELSSLIELEEKFNEPSLVPASPFGFFLSCLDEQEYVKANQKPGVNIFRWRVAAASPFACHFVLNASQSAASVLYQPMKFLRPDKRKRLGLEDSDATGAFITLCGAWKEGSFKSWSRISSSKMSFSGWAIPHSFFAHGNTVSAPASPPDPYSEERRFWKEKGDSLAKIYPLQKHSYELWKNKLALRGEKYSFFTSPVPASTVRELVENAFPREDGCLVVTPTEDLNVYYACAVKWLYLRVFRAKEFSLEAALLDDMALGTLYHKILERLFIKIKNEDRVFDSRHLNDYKSWALEITKTAIRENRAFKGPLAVPLVSPQAWGMAKKLAGVLEKEADNFSGYEVKELEMKVNYKTEDLLVKGYIDRVSVSPDGEPVIVDYKTSDPPVQIPVEKLQEIPLSEFQMPLYIKLYEKEMNSGEAGAAEATEVKGAYFYSINGKRIKIVMGKSSGAKSKAPSREEYSGVLEAAEKQIEEFAKKVKALDFVPRDMKLEDCFKCMYRAACRRTYNLNSAERS